MPSHGFKRALVGGAWGYSFIVTFLSEIYEKAFLIDRSTDGFYASRHVDECRLKAFSHVMPWGEKRGAPFLQRTAITTLFSMCFM